MSLENKKFLDYAGTTHLWEKIKTELDKKGQVNSVTAANNSVAVAGTAAAPTIAVKISSKDGNVLTLDTTSGKEGLYVPTPAAPSTYSITKLSAEATSEGAAATYQLAVDGVPSGTKIDIPKDMVVSSGEVKTVSTANTPYSGAAVGDKYIELTIANAASDKLYIPVNSLVEYVTSGSSNGDMVVVSIDSNHQVTASITDGTITKAKLASGVQDSLDAADSALQATDITTGSTNGTISVDGTDVSVYGLGTAAYTASTAYDTSGSAQAVYDAIIALTSTEIDNAIAAATSGT